ncbi:protein phosphatase 1 regulatory subunit 3C-like [Arapaima gigas]
MKQVFPCGRALAGSPATPFDWRVSKGGSSLAAMSCSPERHTSAQSGPLSLTELSPPHLDDPPLWKHCALKTTCSRMPQMIDSRWIQPVVTPLDLAVQLRESAPLQRVRAVSPLQLYGYTPALFLPTAPSLLTLRSADQANLLLNSVSTPDYSVPKKNVMFADARGLPLTMVHYFSDTEEPASSESDEGQEAAPGNQAKKRRLGRRRRRLQPAFRQPKADFLVNLEGWDPTRRVLSGTVRVRNGCSEKAVHIRVTFDSWRRYWDVPCTPLARETGTFTFSIPLPLNPSPTQQLDYCVYHPGLSGCAGWDDSLRQNLGHEMLCPTPALQPGLLRTSRGKKLWCVHGKDARPWLNHPMSELLVSWS